MVANSEGGSAGEKRKRAGELPLDFKAGKDGEEASGGCVPRCNLSGRETSSKNTGGVQNGAAGEILRRGSRKGSKFDCVGTGTPRSSKGNKPSY